jgi:hypothetical protein
MVTKAEKNAAAMAHARALEPVIRELITANVTSLASIARALNAAGYPALQGGKWAPTQVDFLLQRLGVVLKPPTLASKSISAARPTSEARALADARARIIAELRNGGVTSFAEVARQMNARGITTRDGNVWDGIQVRLTMLRLGIR